jgi:hypothetical protein
MNMNTPSSTALNSALEPQKPIPNWRMPSGVTATEARPGGLQAFSSD